MPKYFPRCFKKFQFLALILKIRQPETKNYEPTEEEAMAEPQPKVLKQASTIFPESSTLIWSFMTSPQAGAPTRPVPTSGSFLSKEPTLRGLLKWSTTRSWYWRRIAWSAGDRDASPWRTLFEARLSIFFLFRDSESFCDLICGEKENKKGGNFGYLICQGFGLRSFGYGGFDWRRDDERTRWRWRCFLGTHLDLLGKQLFFFLFSPK